MNIGRPLVHQFRIVMLLAVKSYKRPIHSPLPMAPLALIRRSLESRRQGSGELGRRRGSSPCGCGWPVCI
jgi:hypothetical protein